MTVGALHDPPAVARRATGRPRDRPRPVASAPPRTRRPACAWSCCRSSTRSGALADWGCGQRRAGDRGRAARLRAGRRASSSTRRRRDVRAAQRAPQRRRRRRRGRRRDGRARRGRRRCVANLTLPLLDGASPRPDAARPAADRLRLPRPARPSRRPGFVERERRELDGWAALVLERRDPARGPRRARARRARARRADGVRARRPGGARRRATRRVRALRRARASCPTCGDVRAAAGGALVDVSTSELPDDWGEDWRSFHKPIDVPARCACGRRGSRRATARSTS